MQLSGALLSKSRRHENIFVKGKFRFNFILKIFFFYGSKTSLGGHRFIRTDMMD